MTLLVTGDENHRQVNRRGGWNRGPHGGGSRDHAVRIPGGYYILMETAVASVVPQRRRGTVRRSAMGGFARTTAADAARTPCAQTGRETEC